MLIRFIMKELGYEQSVVWNALLEEYNTLIKEQGTRK